MTLTMIFASLIGIALVDSLNPSAILMTLFLLSTHKPVPRTLSYISGIALTYFSLGLAVYLGLGELMHSILTNILKPTPLLYALELIAGVLMFLSGASFKIKNKRKTISSPQKLDALSTFALGMGITFVEFTTAAPYLGALAILIKSELSLAYVILSLAFYNLIFIWIPLLFVLIYLLNKDKQNSLMQNMSQKIIYWSNHLLKWVLMLLGLIFLLDSFMFFMKHFI